MLEPEDRNIHMHIIGSSGSGKSKFMEWMMRQDLQNRQGFCLIDPHGTLFDDVAAYCAHKVLDREIILLNLSSPKSIIKLNPFKRRPTGEISVQVDQRITATMHAWGVPNADQTPTLERVLRLIYTTLIEQELSFPQVQHLIDFHAQEIREYLIQKLKSPLIQSEWREIQGLKASEWRNEVLSAKNRLFRLLSSPTLCKFLGTPGEPLDLADVINKQKILLVNLASNPDYLSAENARVFGALLVNELFETARSRHRDNSGRDPAPYYLYLDEFQNFVSLDIISMLDQVRKYGLFTVLAHQRFGQLDENVIDALHTNCRIKAVFGGLPYESAKVMALEMFIGELDSKKIKVAIHQTKFWPQYGRDKVYSYSSSTGHSVGKGENRALSSGTGHVAGESFNGHDWFSSGAPIGQSIVSSLSSSEVHGQHSSETSFTGEAYGEADVPIMLPVPFRELSSVQYYTIEEQVMELTAALKEQFGRHCFIKLNTQKTQPMLVPFVEHFKTPHENFVWYRDKMLSRSGAISATEAERLLEQENESLFKAKGLRRDKPKARPKKRAAVSAATPWDGLQGKE
jgi:hypothetical protein